MIYVSLIHNISLLIALATVHGLLTRRLSQKSVLSSVLSGLLFGWVAVIGMLTPMNLMPGVIFDGRSVILAVAGLFGGGFAAAIAAVMTGVYRLWLGGDGALMGVCVVAESAVVGVVWRSLREKHPRAVETFPLLAFGCTVHLLMLACTLALPQAIRATVLSQIALPVMLVYPPALWLVCRIFLELESRLGVEAALRESEAQWRAMFDLASIGLGHCDPQTGRWLRVNSRMCAITGFAPDRLLTMTGLDLVHPDDRRGHTEAAMLLLRGETNEYNRDERYVRPDGSVVWVNINMVVLRDADRVPVRIFAAVLDITERKRAEAEKDQLQNQLMQAQKMESVGRLAGGVAHDFNNMLQTILSNTALALEQVPPRSQVHEDLLEVERAAHRSSDLTGQLLTFARKQAVSPKLLDLNLTVSSLLKMLQRLIGEDIELLWRPGSNLWPVRLDPSQFDQVLANLTVNARDAISGVGRITIETANVAVNESTLSGQMDGHVGDFVRLKVSDTGCGMAPEVRVHLFEPFFTTKTLGSGTGLGLATVYGVVKQNGGFIHVRSEIGQGTTFELYFPRVEKGDVAAVHSTSASESRRGHETILLVEDEEQILSIGRRILEQHGYTVLTASMPEAALERVRSYAGPLDLLITDVVMPGLNGRELLDRVSSLRPGIRSLFMSGYTADVIANQGIIPDGVEFIQKPFSIEALTAKVRHVLDCSRPDPG